MLNILNFNNYETYYLKQLILFLVIFIVLLIGWTAHQLSKFDIYNNYDSEISKLVIILRTVSFAICILGLVYYSYYSFW
jgi:hypothetical protein